jgi:branched-chain amino acid aminotransferase
MQKAEVIWFNGELVPWDEARVHVLSHALHYGTSVFEGLRAYATPRGPAVLALDGHVTRFYRSCKVLGIELAYEPAVLREAILATVRRNGHDACYIRPLAWRGEGALQVAPTDNTTELIVATWAWGALHGATALEEGIDVGVSSWRRMAPDTHPALAKIGGNYVNSNLVLAEAQANGFAEGLVLDTEGYVCEGSGENVFLLLDGRVLTPALGDSILPGLTRGMVVELLAELGVELVEQRVAREMLYYADEIFLTGTAAEITPVRSVDRKPVGAGRRGELTRRLQAAFFALVRGEVPDRRGWLTYVNRA